MEQKQLDNKQFYIQRQRKRMLGNSLEFTTSRLGWQVSLALTVILFLATFDFKTGTSSIATMAVTIIYGIGAIFQFYVTHRITNEILNKGEVSKATRIMGIFLIPFILVGNIFLGISGFMIIRKEKGIEYNLSIYALLSTVIVILVSLINIFKEYVSTYFMLGMGLLAIVTIINIIVIIAVCRFVHATRVDKKMLPFAIIAIITGATGNIFSIILGCILIAKIRNADKEVSVEWVDVVRRLFKNYMSVIGLFFIIFLVMIAICSYMTFDYDMAVVNNYSALLQPPSLDFPFGTDNFGRCLFTRIIFGARISLVVGLISTAIPIVIGGMLGAFSGFYGNRTDNIIMRFLDILYAVPGMLLAIAIIAAFGANTVNLIIALSIGSIPMYARTVRASVMTLAGQEFVEASRACGAKNSRIILKHIIPNSLAPIIVRSTLGIGSAVLSTSSLSFLGLGVESHIPEWGNILKAGSTFIEINPYIAIFPGLAIILIVLAFNYFGDGLRDALDPKLK